VTRATLPPETPAVRLARAQHETLEAWALAYVTTDDLEAKVAPTIPPEATLAPEARATLGPPPARPGRPPELLAARKAAKTPGKDALREPSKRAQILHTFFHHELQAAELFAWAILAYPDADSGFRRGVARLLLDEARHMRLYRDRIRALGYDIAFVATLGLGFEGGNLDHAARFAERFAAVGDEESAALQRRVAQEEEPHVRFALRWFEKFTGAVTYEGFAHHLPPPLTPGLMRGKRLETEARLRAGFPAPFLEELAACPLV
jgi:uncharacterized ferritin-like protein (DUF455 family)